MRSYLPGLATVSAGAIALAALASLAQDKLPGFALVPAGSFEMGDHHGFVDPKHGGDETPDPHSASGCLLHGHLHGHDQGVLRFPELGAGGKADRSPRGRGLSRRRERPAVRNARNVALQPDWLGRQGLLSARQEGEPSHRLHPLAGRGGLLQLVERAEGQAPLLQHNDMGLRLQQERLPPADRGRVGIRRARRLAEPLSEFPLGRRAGRDEGELAGIQESLPRRPAAVDNAQSASSMVNCIASPTLAGRARRRRFRPQTARTATASTT